MKDIKVGDTLSFNGEPFQVIWSSNDMTDAERYESHMRTADFMEAWGISGAFQRMLAARYSAKSEALRSKQTVIVSGDQD
jgi:hypothetical protein